MQEHIHSSQRPGASVYLHTEKSKVTIVHLTRSLNQKATGTTSRITDPVSGFGTGQFGNQLRYFMRRIELPGFFAGIRSKALDQIDIRIADDILGNAAGTHIKLRLVEILQQHLQAAVAIFGLAEVGLAIEVDIAKHSFKLGLIGFFYCIERYVNQLAYIGLVTLLMEIIETGAFWENKTLTFQFSPDTNIIITILLTVFFITILPYIRYVFYKHHY